jgi:hypothetical protein
MAAKKFAIPVVLGLVTLALWTFLVEPQIAKQLAASSSTGA